MLFCLQYKQESGDDFPIEVSMLVHQSQAGAVIGRAGFKIKEFREVSFIKNCRLFKKDAVLFFPPCGKTFKGHVTLGMITWGQG